MPASVKLILRKDKQKADGTCPVYLRATSNRRSRYIVTGVYVEPVHWNEGKQEVRKSHPMAPSMNVKLAECKVKATEAALSARTAENVIRAVDERHGSLSAYFRRFIVDLDNKGRFWDWKKYKVTLGKLEDCFGADVLFGQIDRAALIRFERYLREKCENGPNTVRKELSRLGRVFRLAAADGTIKPGDNPFLIYDRPKAKRPNRRKLTPEEIGKLAALDLAADSWPRVARDAFLVSFYGAGIRFSDLARLKPENVHGTRIEYRMAKTGHLISVNLPPVALAILRPYLDNAGPFIFPFLEEGEDTDPIHVRRRISSMNVVSNRVLKDVVEQAGIRRSESVSFHVARHSYADFARHKSGDLYAISKSLGHTNLATTEAYLKSFDRDATDRLSDQLWSD